MRRAALRPTLAAVAALAAAGAPAGGAHAQAFGDGLAFRVDPAIGADATFAEPPLGVDGRYVVIRIAENRLYLIDRGRVVWHAPVGTGSGFRLESAGREWHFETPRGVFRIQRREKDPVWIKPDWAYIREGRPVPPLHSPERRHEGMLGTTALYIGYELAIHGTSEPELVLRPDPDDRRVSAGCIRMTNEDARALYHRVEVGTPVLIY